VAKVSPNRNTFNAGVFSALVEGRVDIDKYPASLRSSTNFVASPQGPALRRSGTYFVSDVKNHAKYSTLVPFVFNEEQSLMLEFSNLKLRFLFDEGAQTQGDDAITNILTTTPMKFTSAALNLRVTNVGDQVALNGFPSSYNLNGRVFNITVHSGNDYTIDVNYPGTTGAVTAKTASLLYQIDSPYTDEDARDIRAVQSIDVVYLFCDGYRPRKLSRYGLIDWRFSTIEFDSGPFMPVDTKNGVITMTGTGNPVPIMTGNTTPSGTASADSEDDGSDTSIFGGDDDSGTPHLAWNAFNEEVTTWWQPESTQRGILMYQFTAPIVINGYTIYIPRFNDNDTYTALDYAPSDFEFMGYDGSNWISLDSQIGYVLYDSGRSVTFPFNNSTAYAKYGLFITKCYRNGDIPPRVARLVMSTTDTGVQDTALILSGDYTRLNGGVGFRSTDVGRYIRAQGKDSFWRIAKIVAYTDATHITVRIIGEPFPSAANPVRNWQIAYWSDGTGWPRVGVFFNDSLFMGGNTDAPDMVAGSRTGAYEDFTQRTPINEVLDDSALVIRLNSRRLSRVQWLETDERGLLIGTGSAEWVVSASNADAALTAKNVKARSSTARGSAFVEPVKVDRQVLYVQAARRTVREYAYVFQSDGYASPSMSLFASQMGVPRFAQMAYSAEPHNLVWMRRDDGSVVCLTYNREENVIGWHSHSFSGVVECVASKPSATDKQDILWIVVNRTINGQTKRYIERLMPFWDFDSTLDTAHFVDSGLRYEGAATDIIYGLTHLEGKAVEGLADGIPFGPLTVTNGRITLPFEAENVVVGLPFTSEAETSNIEAGAADGTAQGKVKRPHNVSIQLWDTADGEVGRLNEDNGENEWRDIKYEDPAYEMAGTTTLFSGICGPFDMPGGYGKRGSIMFRQTKPLPFNVIAILPQTTTQDR
jgi:hypothetical protein